MCDVSATSARFARDIHATSTQPNSPSCATFFRRSPHKSLIFHVPIFAVRRCRMEKSHAFYDFKQHNRRTGSIQE